MAHWLSGSVSGEESRGKLVETARAAAHLVPRCATRQLARQSAGGGHAGLGAPGWCAKLQMVSRLTAPTLVCSSGQGNQFPAWPTWN